MRQSFKSSKGILSLLLTLLFSVNPQASDIYLIPDDSELVLYKLKRDIRKSNNIDISTNEFSDKKMFRIIIKALNRKGVKVNIILDPDRYSLISKLSIYKGVMMKTLSGIGGGLMNLNFILIDNSILYLFSNSLNKISLNQSYGTVIRFKDIKTIKSFRKIFNILMKRSSTINNYKIVD